MKYKVIVNKKQKTFKTFQEAYKYYCVECIEKKQEGYLYENGKEFLSYIPARYI